MKQQKPLVRVTQIEAFRRYLANGDNDRYEITEQSVIDSVTGAFEGNSYTRVGTAFHAIIQHGEGYGAPIEGGYQFDIDGHEVCLSNAQRQVALDYSREHSLAFHEIRLRKNYGRAIVTGCADMIDGVEIRDIKTKYSAPSDKDYIDSCQWRYYLDIFCANVFHFDLFVFQGYDKEKHGYDVRPLELTRHTPPITCYRYPQMESDNIRLLNEFMDWAEARDLIKYLINPKIN